MHRIHSIVRLSLRAVCGLLAFFVILSWHGEIASAASKQKLEQALLENAPEILKRLEQDGLHRVGVLKFRIIKGRSPQDDAGALNMRFADQLETALAIAGKACPTNSVKLVRNASATAAKIEGASHLSDDGRKALFAKRYAPAIGQPEVTVDAFVTGVLRVSPDLQDIQASILLVLRKEPWLQAIEQFNFKIDGQILNEIGENFQLRSVNDDPIASAQRVRSQPQNAFPLVDKPSVSLQVFYDKRPVALEFRDGGAWIPEPQAGQTVTMALKRLDRSPGKLGVVVKVNGENTLYRERLRDVDCHRWVLEGQGSARTLLGYSQKNNGQAEEFQVAAHDESNALEMYYGPDVGTISLVAFRQVQAPPPQQVVGAPADAKNAPDLEAIAKAQFPGDLASPAGPDDGVRGIIVPGKQVADAVKMERVYWSPEPVMSVVIRYYHPQPR